MKKFRVYIIVLILFYLISSFAVYKFISFSSENTNNTYRIEINRIMSEAAENYGDIKDGSYDFSLPNSNEIKSVKYLPLTSLGNDEILEFYQINNSTQMEIQPLIIDEEVVGYLRFDYIKTLNKIQINFITELAISLIFGFSLLILLFVYFKVIKPFNKLSQLPYDFSAGNLTGEIKENKNRYFGKFIWGISMLRDSLDTHKRHELKLARDKKMIVLSISHDIKTPLNAISLYAKTIKDGLYESKEELSQTSISILSKTDEINNFVNQLVKSSTEDIVTLNINIIDFYLKDLVEKIQKGFLEKCRLQGIDLKINKYENILLKGDPDRIFEAVGNLIENAIKYGDGKEIVVSFFEEDNYQMISFFNTGIEIAYNEMPHIFDSFYRGSNSQGKQGNGLGLYICKNIMLKCGGDIYAKKIDGGMEFVLVCKES